MRLGVYLTRRSMLKTLSPVVDASLRRGHQTILVAEQVAAKRGDRLDLDELKRLWPDAQVVVRDDGLWWPVLDGLVGIVGALPSMLPCRTVGVDQFYDCWLKPPRYDQWFTMAYTSCYHRVKHERLWSIGTVQNRVVGWLPADQEHSYMSAYCDRDAAVFFALKLDVPEPWRKSREGRAAYKEIAREAKRRARAAGLEFVVKSRRKNQDPLWLRLMADRYVLDECMVPYTSLSLLARAKWCVHFESGAAFEAALMGAYGIAIAVPQPHVKDLPGGSLNFGHAAWNDWPGVSQYDFPVGIVPTVDPEARSKYLETFLGPCDGKAGERVVDIAEGT